MRSTQVANLNLGNHISFCLNTQVKQDNRRRDGRPVAGPSGCVLTSSQQFEKKQALQPLNVFLTLVCVCVSV